MVSRERWCFPFPETWGLTSDYGRESRGSEARGKAESQAYHNEHLVKQNEEELTKEHRSQKPQRQKMGKIHFCPFDLKAMMLLENKTNYSVGLKIELRCLIRVRVDVSPCSPKGKKNEARRGT